MLWATAPAFGATGFFGPTDGIADLGYTCYGCTTPIFTNLVPAMRQLGIFPNRLAVSASERDTDFLASDGTCRSTDYLALARIASYLATSPDVPRPFILDLSGVIFEPTPLRNCACDRAGTCSNTWSLRADYQARLDMFQQVASGNFDSPSVVWGIVLFSEIANVNGTIADGSTINTVVSQINQRWPLIKVIGGYPTCATRSDYGMANTPLYFPYKLNYILTWDYCVSDPNVGQYPAMYSDPNLGLGRRLRSWQSLVYVVGTFGLNTNPGTCPARSVVQINQGQRFDVTLREWCAWALNSSSHRTNTLLPFYWGQPGGGGAKYIINWENANCGGTALLPAFVSAANAAATGSSCWQ